MDKKGNLLSAIEDTGNDSISLANLMRERRGHVRRTRSVDVQELCGIAAVHPLPWVRHATSQELYRRKPDNDVLLELALWLSHDYDDYAAFSALDFLGLRGSRDHLRHIYSIIGIASDRLFTTAGKPVGIGHAVALRAIQRIVDSRDRKVYQEIEQSLFQGLDDTEFVNQPSDLDTHHEHSHRSMSWIPKGTVRMGMPSSMEATPRVFDWSETVRTLDVPGFHLDVNPVTTGEYRTFALSEAARTHEFCHSREPSGKVHLVDGVHDGNPSERALWIDGEPTELGPNTFAADLTGVAFAEGGALDFTQWSVREENVNRLIVRSRYRQPFGTFTGQLPGGLKLAEGYGVMEEHDVHW